MRERELKVTVDASFVIPPLDEAIADTVLVPAPARTNRDVYFDTDDLRLIRWGVTVRWRKGTGWVVKIPAPRSGPGLDRYEIEFPGRPGRPPAEALALVAAFSRGVDLAPVADITTARTRLLWQWGDATMAAELADDDVTGVASARAGRPASEPVRFREIEVELAPDTGIEVLDRMVELLAVDPALVPVPKVALVLGPDALAPPDVAPLELGPDPSGAVVIQVAIATSVARLIRHLPIVAIGIDPEGVHQARVATRRLRSDLKTFGPLIDPEWASRLRQELRWLAAELGRVRDADVLDILLRDLLARHPEIDPVGGERILAALHRQRDTDRAVLLGHLTDERTLTLLDHLVAGAAAPRLLSEADQPAAAVLPSLVRKPWRKLRQAVEALPADPPDEELHAIRILGKGVRYASEAVAPAVGRPARRFGVDAAVIQTVLGERNDAAVAGHWLESAARTMRGAAPFAAGRLAQQLIVDSAAEAGASDEWRRAYQSMLKRTSWLDGSPQ